MLGQLNAETTGVQSRLLLLAAAVLWSTAGAAMKLCQLSGGQIAGGRALVAALFLFLAVRGARARPSWPVLATGAAYAATGVCFAVANKLTTAANAIFIQSTAPLWVALLSPRLLGERASRAALWTIPVYAAGLGCFFLDELSPGQLLGNAVALGAGLAFALCTLGLRKLRAGSTGALVYGNLLAALVTAPLWLSGPAPAPMDLLALLYLGVFQLGLSYLCFARGVAHTPALEASLLVLLEPVLNPIWTFFIAGERPGPWAIGGGTVVLSATLWRTLAPLWSRRRPDVPVS
ncbi:MAG TPA: DMT family transporter [Polyangiaceae bacterium]|jgi:drug/metabolite transporter (DMT)-like permease|nr:DMT family transporter [Polyangiaceae bacterium]